MLGHYSREEKHKFIIFSVAGIVATLVLTGIFFSLFSVKKEIGIRKNLGEIDRPETLALKNSVAVVSQYAIALENLSAEIRNSLVGEPTVLKVETALFAMRVPKEMLDKHLPAVLAVGKLKEEKDNVVANEGVRKIVDGLLVEALGLSLQLTCDSEESNCSMH